MNFFCKIFYDINVYKKSLKWGFFKTASYLLLMCVLLATSVVFTTYTPIKQEYLSNINQTKQALEKIKIVDGKAVPLKEGEIEIKSQNGDVFAIISAKTIDASKIKNLLFTIEGSNFSIYQQDEEMSINMDSLDFGQDPQIKSLADVIPSWDVIKFTILPIVAFFTCLSITAWHLLIMGTFAFIIDIPYRKLRFANSLKLAILAITPAVLINLAFSIILSKPIPESIMVIISVAMLYYVVINIIKKQTPQTTQAQN